MPRSNNTYSFGSIKKKTTIRKGKEYVVWEVRISMGYDPVTGKLLQKSVSGKTQNRRDHGKTATAMQRWWILHVHTEERKASHNGSCTLGDGSPPARKSQARWTTVYSRKLMEQSSQPCFHRQSWKKSCTANCRQALQEDHGKMRNWPNFQIPRSATQLRSRIPPSWWWHQNNPSESRTCDRSLYTASIRTCQRFHETTKFCSDAEILRIGDLMSKLPHIYKGKRNHRITVGKKGKLQFLRVNWE